MQHLNIGVYMKKLMLLAAMLLFVGCGETTNNTTTVTQGDNGVYISNGDGTITYTADSYNEGDASDGVTGEFDDEADEEECKAGGRFWCPITKTCNNVSGSGGTCSGRK